MESGQLPEARCASRDDDESDCPGIVRRDQAVEQQVQKATCDFDVASGTRRSRSVVRAMKRGTPCTTHSMSTDIRKDLTEGHKNGDVWWLQPDGKTRSTTTRSSKRYRLQSCPSSLMDTTCILPAITLTKETTQTDVRSTSSTQVENVSSD